VIKGGPDNSMRRETSGAAQRPGHPEIPPPCLPCASGATCNNLVNSPIFKEAIMQPQTPKQEALEAIQRLPDTADLE